MAQCGLPRTIGFALGIGLIASILVAAPAGSDEILVDGVAAQVGSDIVLVSEVMSMVEPAERQMRELGAPENEIAKLRAEGLERMIEWRLIEQIVRRFDLQATDEEVDTAIQGIADENGISLDQLKQSLQGHGLNYPEYRSQIRRELEQHRVMGTMVRYKVVVEEQQVRDLYQRRYGDQPAGGQVAHLRQILVLFGAEAGIDKQTARQRIEQAAHRIAEGERFEVVASQMSSVAATKGGDLGWLPVERLSEPLWAAVSQLALGQTSEVIELPMGWSLFQLLEVKEYTFVAYEEAKPALEQEIFEKQMAIEYGNWLEELREKTFIQRRGYFAAAAELGSSSNDAGTRRNP